LETSVNPTAQFFGIEFDLTILAMSLLTVLVAFVLIFWFSRNMQLKPKGKQNVLEWVYEFVQGIIRPNLGRYTSNYGLLFFGLFFFLLIANNIGLLTKLEVGDYNLWSSPTSNAAYNFGLALLIAVVVHVEGIRKNGIKEYLKEYLSPTPVMLPMNILEEFTNVISLTLRLYGNIFAGEIVELACAICTLQYRSCTICIYFKYALDRVLNFHLSNPSLRICNVVINLCW